MQNNDGGKVRITLSTEDILNHPIAAAEDGRSSFYRFIAEDIMKKDWDDIEIVDCRKINVSPDIQKAWYERAAEVGINRGDFSVFLTMQGPKAPEDLPPRTVELQEGWCSMKPLAKEAPEQSETKKTKQPDHGHGR